MATLKDIAEETGLTVTTVSRVLNNRGYISEDARIKVHEAMMKLNYHPNEVARSLSKSRTNNIGVIVPHVKHPYFAEMISELEKAANLKDHRILVCNTGEKELKEIEYLEMCVGNRVAGVILFSAGVAAEKFVSDNFPIITVERNLEKGTAAVQCDNFQGGRLAAEHLIGLGCRNLLHVSGVEERIMPADDRAKGFISVCEETGVEHRELATNRKMYYSLDYHELIEDALRSNDGIDGIFASSDLIAAQVIQVCHKLGRRIPEDIKLVGFDDVIVSRLTTPTITTIHQPIREMAQRAVDLVIRASQGEPVSVKTMLPVHLVERESTKMSE